MIIRFLRLLGIAIYSLHLHPLVIWWNRRHPKVLLYHDIAPSVSPFTEGIDVELSPELYAKHMDFIDRYYRVVDLSELEHTDYGCAVTFDDGYKGLFDYVMPVMASRSLPVTSFLVTDVVGNRSMVWVNELAYYLNTSMDVAVEAIGSKFPIAGLTQPEKILEAVKFNFDLAGIEACLAEMAQKLDVDRSQLAEKADLYLTWDQIKLMKEAGWCFGNHTGSHPNLNQLTKEECQLEVERGHTEILNQLGECDYFAYPFGFFNKDAKDLVVERGYQGVCEVGGSNRPFDSQSIGRVIVDRLSVAGLFAEVEIVAPILRGLLRVKRAF